MKHFVITRIGIGIYDANRLKKMIDLFGAVTLPSLLNQASQNFTSLIVTDSNIPKENLNHLLSLIKNNENFHLVEIDVTTLENTKVGSFDWVWDQCQNFIIKSNLLEDLNDYILTSVLDADDAWHHQLTSSIEKIATNNILSFVEAERTATTWTGHSSGMVITIPNGYAFFAHAQNIGRMQYKFHSMAVFVTSRFSSGISVCSSRHSQWESFSKVVDFKIAVWSDTPPMWIYTRHDEGVVPWDSSKGKTINDDDEKMLSNTFGINFNHIKTWNTVYNKTLTETYKGKSAREQYNLIFKISIINRAIKILSAEEENLKIKKILEKKRQERAHLISNLFSTTI